MPHELSPAPGSGAPRERPIPSHWSVRAGRDAYLAENGFSVEAYDAPRTEASVLRIRFSIPNTPQHRWAIQLHDLHHVATGYGTDHTGEAEISAWEAAQSLRGLGLYVGTIVVSGALLGLSIAPLRTLRAWRAARAPSSLFQRDDLAYEALLQLTVGELRALLGVPDDGLCERPRRLHAFAPAP